MVQLRQVVPKPLRDTVLTAVVAKRYGCLHCGRTFRVYPMGIDQDQTSARLTGVAVMFSELGTSHGVIAEALRALGFPLSKVAVDNYVQATGAAMPGLEREAVRHWGDRVVALSADLTSITCAGRWSTLGPASTRSQGSP